MKTEEVGKALDRVKSIIVTSEQMAPTAVSDVRPLLCPPSCPMSRVAMAWRSQ